jgi:hypothetical protein
VRRRDLPWSNHLAECMPDSRQTLTKAEFIDGRTTGPVASGR